MTDTGLNPPVGGPTTVCGTHEECLENIYQRMNAKASKWVLVWTLGIFAGVGGSLAIYVNNRTSKNSDAIQSVRERMVAIETKLENVIATQKKVEATEARHHEETLRKFEELRDLIKNGR